MKKYITVFLSFILMISLCACGGKTSVKFEPKLNRAFSVTVQIKYDEQESSAVIKRLGKDNWDVEFSSPNTLAGVLLSYRDGNVEASYKGLSFSVPKSALPLKSIISSLIDIVDKTAEMQEISCEEKDGVYIMEGETEQGKYTLKMDKNGALTGFSMPNLNLEMTFTDFMENGSGTIETTQAVPEETAAPEIEAPSEITALEDQPEETQAE